MSLKRPALLLALSGPAFGARAPGESGGLFEDSQWSLSNRLQSGFTRGAVGLSLSAAYVRGSGIDGSHADPRGGYVYLGCGEGGRVT